MAHSLAQGTGSQLIGAAYSLPVGHHCPYAVHGERECPTRLQCWQASIIVLVEISFQSSIVPKVFWPLTLNDANCLYRELLIGFIPLRKICLYHGLMSSKSTELDSFGLHKQ